jgi:hypothetical protein
MVVTKHMATAWFCKQILLVRFEIDFLDAEVQTATIASNAGISFAQ